MQLSKSEFTLIINGSTVKNKNEKDGYDRLECASTSIAGNFKDVEFQLPEDVAIGWFQKVLECVTYPQSCRRYH